MNVYRILFGSLLNNKRKIKNKKKGGAAAMRRFLYKALKYSNDISAIKRGKVGKRIARRTAGKAAGKTFRRLFK